MRLIVSFSDVRMQRKGLRGKRLSPLLMGRSRSSHPSPLVRPCGNTKQLVLRSMLQCGCAAVADHNT